MIKLLQEALWFAYLYSLFLVILFIKQGARTQLYNYPISIQNRCIHLGIITKKELKHNASRNKTFGVLMMIGLCLFMICGVNQETTFIHGFFESYLFLLMFSLFDALFIDTIWFCHSKFWIIHGTEDMIHEYRNYAFHWKWFFLSIISTVPLSIMIGGLTYCIGTL